MQHSRGSPAAVGAARPAARARASARRLPLRDARLAGPAPQKRLSDCVIRAFRAFRPQNEGATSVETQKGFQSRPRDLANFMGGSMQHAMQSMEKCSHSMQSNCAATKPGLGTQMQ